ncbi:MAG: hypothetical protein IKZ21_02730 [Clostridia bacterium]|nr:hypothetical protein [Clostridia bacterium]
MKYAVKKPIPFRAIALGTGHPEEIRLLEEGKLKIAPDGSYRVFSLEVRNGEGEIVPSGDYIKFSSDGWPYPNTKAFFEANHRPLGEDLYEQLPRRLATWTVEDGITPEIAFLQQKRGFIFHPETPDAYVSAPLWGTTLTAGRDAVILFYNIHRDNDGHILDIEFNFVAKHEFDLTYDWIE